ncbi:MAG: hypothetical protein HOH04_15660 [Rhodospirillaceae bacterium]|jgi:hypothetical protein|nr:hypothetical protein [Rhodospirillaceae bacterium]
MTTFLGAMPRESTSTPTHFRLNAGIEPSVLPRVLDVFAKLAIVPDAFIAERKPDQKPDEVMAIDIHVAGLDAQQADHLASRLRSIIYVDSVFVSLA